MWPYPLADDSGGIARSDTDTRENAMFEYDMNRLHHAELVREAAAERLARQAVTARRAAEAARSESQESEGRVGPARGRFVRAA